MEDVFGLETMVREYEFSYEEHIDSQGRPQRIGDRIPRACGLGQSRLFLEFCDAPGLINAVPKYIKSL